MYQPEVEEDTVGGYGAGSRVEGVLLTGGKGLGGRNVVRI